MAGPQQAPLGVSQLGLSSTSVLDLYSFAPCLPRLHFVQILLEGFVEETNNNFVALTRQQSNFGKISRHVELKQVKSCFLLL